MYRWVKFQNFHHMDDFYRASTVLFTVDSENEDT